MERNGNFRVVDSAQWKREREEFDRVLGPVFLEQINECYIIGDVAMLEHLRELVDLQKSLFKEQKVLNKQSKL